MRFFVPGHPAPQGSKQAFVRGKRAVLVEVSKRVKPWREAVQDAAITHGCQPLDGPVWVMLTFLMPRPKAMPKSAPLTMCARPDLDKLARAVLDALTGVCFEDDSQVTRLLVVKRRAGTAEEPGVMIHVEQGEEIPNVA